MRRVVSFSLRALHIGAAITLLAAAPVRAAADTQQPGLNEAKELIELMKVESTIDMMFEKLGPLFGENVASSLERNQAQAMHMSEIKGKPGGRERFVAILGEEFLQAMRARYPDMKATAAKEYAGQFTPQELSSLTAFFRSGAGAKWLEKSPAMQASLSKWGEQAGQQAGSVAVVAALARADKEILGMGAGGK